MSSSATKNPLLEALSTAQVDLLIWIAMPVIAAQYSGGVGRWAAWAYVSEQFEREHPDLDALEVWNSLPRVPGLSDGIPGVPGRRPYGLVWRGDNHTNDPTYEERVGLSIAGFYQLARYNRAPLVARALLLVLGSLAEREDSSVRASVDGPGSEDVELDGYTSWFTKGHREKPYAIQTAVVGECLRHEYFLVSCLENEAGWKIRLGARRMRPYLGLDGNVELYLAKVVQHSGLSQVVEVTQMQERNGPGADSAARTSARVPSVFVGSSSERLRLCRFIQSELEDAAPL